jgi:hypothetical protein
VLVYGTFERYFKFYEWFALKLISPSTFLSWVVVLAGCGFVSEKIGAMCCLDISLILGFVLSFVRLFSAKYIEVFAGFVVYFSLRPDLWLLIYVSSPFILL